MAELSAVFNAVDNISGTLESMANAGAAVVDQWEGAGAVANEAFDTAAEQAAKAADAFEEAASSTDYWTAAVNNYDTGALEAIYTTEELVEMGFKTQEALEAEAESAEMCATAADQLATATEAATQIQEDLAHAQEDAAEVAARVADNDKIAAETKDELSAAMDQAEQAASALSAAEEQAASAAEHLASVTADASASQEELEAAAEQAANAAEQLATANGNAATATENLADAVGQATAEEEKMGDSGSESIQQIQQAITAAGLAVLLKEIGEAALEMANAFSEAESIIVKATGATGDALDSLSESMMSIYASAPEEMANVASAVGEINTRLGLQGEELESVTSLFVDYARITDSDVTESVQNVTKVMKNWNVEVSETEALLDKFSYAAQASSASVDELSDLVYSNKAYLDQLGYSLDESIALFAMFEYEGLNATTMMTGFRTAINGFTDEGLDASEAMQDVIGQIASMGDASEATALAVDTFGARAGAQLADAIQTGRFGIDDWVAAIASADGTLATTAEAAMTLEDKWTQASNSMSAAFSSVLSPAIEGISGAFAGLVQGVGDFLGRHPALVAALSGAAVGIAAVVAAFTVYTAVTTVASAVTTVFGTAATAALLPLTAIVAAIGAVVAVGALLISKLTSANEEYNALTATSKNYYDQLEQLNAEYDEAVELYGENSAAARQLAADIAGLEAMYESTAMTLEEFVAQNDALLESHDALIEGFSSSMSALDEEANTADALVTKLEQLSAKSSLTAGEQMQMEAVVGKLNTMYPDLALSIDETTGALEQSVDVYRALAEAQVEEQRVAQQYDSYCDLIADRVELEEQLAVAQAERQAAQERYDEAGWWSRTFGQAGDDLEAFIEEEERLQNALDETNGLLEDHEAAFEAAAQAAAESAAYDEWVANVESAAANVETALETLSEAYERAYEAALSSIQGQYNLWDDVAEVAAKDTETVTSKVNDQITYWENYNANLAQLGNRAGDIEGLSDVISSFADGSADSVSMIAGMAEATDAELEAMVESFKRLEEVESTTADSLAGFDDDVREALEGTQTAINEFAESLEMSDEVAEYAGGVAIAYAEGFAEHLEEIQAAFTDAAGQSEALDVSDEANGYGVSIGSRYAAGIAGQIGAARTAAASLAAAVADALSGTSVSVTASVTGSKRGGYASGADSAEPGIALVGEEGPELIDFSGGEVVYTAAETAQILSGAGGGASNVDPVRALDAPRETTTQQVNTCTERHIILDVVGKGKIDITGGYDETAVLDLLQEHMRPLLLSILQAEMTEEGDGSYGF